MAETKTFREDKKWVDRFGKMESVFSMCKLFDDTAKNLSIEFNYKYDTAEAKNSFQFLKDIKILPDDADEIY